MRRGSRRRRAARESGGASSNVEEWARAAGARALHLSVADRAEAAAALYRSAGFEPDGQRTDSRHTSGLVEIGLAKRLG